MKISILTLFPEMFNGPFAFSIVKKAKEKGLLEINLVNIRDFGIGKHKTVDDTLYGGGVGMLLRVDVLHKALLATKDPTYSPQEEKAFLLQASGKLFNQKMAYRFSGLKHLILICGHYEGVDKRFSHFIDGEISIGKFILTGGEIPSMLIADSVARLIKGVLKDEATLYESFSQTAGVENVEHPQYTKPREYKNLKVPNVLLSGNHQEITKWRAKQSRPIKKKS